MPEAEGRYGSGREVTNTDREAAAPGSLACGSNGRDTARGVRALSLAESRFVGTGPQQMSQTRAKIYGKQLEFCR